MASTLRGAGSKGNEGARRGKGPEVYRRNERTATGPANNPRGKGIKSRGTLRHGRYLLDVYRRACLRNHHEHPSIYYWTQHTRSWSARIWIDATVSPSRVHCQPGLTCCHWSCSGVAWVLPALARHASAVPWRFWPDRPSELDELELLHPECMSVNTPTRQDIRS
jgi:hypothetical protein